MSHSWKFIAEELGKRRDTELLADPGSFYSRWLDEVRRGSDQERCVIQLFLIRPKQSPMLVTIDIDHGDGEGARNIRETADWFVSGYMKAGESLEFRWHIIVPGFWDADAVEQQRLPCLTPDDVH